MSTLLLTVVLVVLVETLLLGYFYLVQRKHYDVTMAALGTVDEVRVRETATFSLPAPAGAAVATGEDARKTPQPLTIEGAKTVTVGRRSGPFVVVDPVAPDSTVRWSVEPTGMAGVEASGTAVALYPVVDGALTLVATVTDAAGTVTHHGSFTTTAVAAAGRTATLELPWVGQGVGTLVVSVLVLGVVLYLAAEGILDAAVVAAIVTAIAGYVYGARNTASS